MVRVKEDMTGWKMWEHRILDSRLTVLCQTEDHIYPNGQHRAQWLCECGCEKHTQLVVLHNNLRNGNTKSCGCLDLERITAMGRNNKRYNDYRVNIKDEYGLYGIGYCSNTGNEFYFDMDDYDKIKNYCWYEHILSNGYHALCAECTDHKGTIRMHTIIVGKYYDHADRNPLNNRKYNLRQASPTENSRNKKIPNNNTSGTIGIYKNKKTNKWIASIGVNHQNVYIGTFTDKTSAIIARLQAELKYFGPDFAPQRHLFEQYGIT